MPAYNESQIKMALTAAKDIVAAKDTRRAYPALRRVDLAERSQILINQRAAEQLLASCLTKTNGEVAKFDELLAQNQTAFRRILEQRKADAIERSQSVKEALRSGVDARRKAIEHLATLTRPDSPAIAAPTYQYIDAPFLIWPTNGMVFQDSHVEPWNSWAKFTLDSDESTGYEEMSFYFVWDNPSDSYAVINVDTSLLVSGYFQTGSEGGFFPGDRRSALTVTARLNLLEWWNQPPTSPIGQADQAQQVLHLQTSTGGFNDPGAIEYEDVYNWYNLRYNLFLIPPHGVVVFDVTLAASYSLSNGSIHIDVASGDFKALCPSVLITTLT